MLWVRQRLLRAAFRLLYNELAWSYDVVSWVVSLGQWRQWQQAGLAYLPEAAGGRNPVLELAHGTGHMMLALQDSGYAAYGIDLSRAMSRLAQRRLTRGGRAAPICRARAQALPFPDGQFAGALATFPAEFIVEQATLLAVHRVLRPGGRFVLVPMARLTGDRLIDKLLEWLYTITGQRLSARGADGRAGLFARPLEDAGFHVAVHDVNVPGSVVTVVVAQKMP